jgi:hypothetical protein
MGNEFVIKNGFISKTDSEVQGALSAVTYYGDGSNLTGLSGSTNWISSGTSIYYNDGNVGIGTTTPTEKLEVSGNTKISGQIIAEGVSATTYYNLPIDIRTTGVTVSDGSVFFNRNDVMSAYTISFSGVNIDVISDDINKKITFSASTIPSLNEAQIFIGNTSDNTQARDVIGDISLNYSGLTTIQPNVVTYDKMQTVSQPALLGSTTSGGTVSEILTVEAYVNTGSTAATLLDDANNWNQYGVYTGSSISGTSLGQSHYNDNYWYTAIQDNVWIRLIRG